MLVALSIHDIVLIERLSIDLTTGLTVFTGETGAGKSILLDSLSLALGGRGDAGLVRQGAAQGDVTAVFELPSAHPVWAVLNEGGIETDGELILRRVQAADGRSRAFINDQPVSVSLLRQVGATLVEIHGQHDDRAMVDPAIHRGLLDAFGGLSGDAQKVGAAAIQVRETEAAAAKLRARIDAAEAEAAYIRSTLEELQALDPQPDEEDELADRRQRLMRAEKVAGDISEAYDIVSGSASPVPTLAGLARRLERKVSDAGPLFDETIAGLDRALTALEEASSALEHAAAEARADPEALEQTEERLFALRAAARKHGIAVVALPDLMAQMTESLAALDSGEQELEKLDAAAAAARRRYEELARKLSARREKAAKALEKAAAAELPALKLDRAVFSVAVERDAERLSEAGFDDVSFTVQTNPGSRPGPLMKVASGGELARFLLAIKVALADRGSAPTLVFDEIDTAVGGAVADAIGVRLARLADRVQVLSVTHAPQVAARAGSHLLVAKASGKKRDVVLTSVNRLDEGSREEEIARMLAGATVTDEARAAAVRLIKGAA